MRKNKEVQEVQHLFGLLGVGIMTDEVVGNVLFDDDYDFAKTISSNIKSLESFEKPDLVLKTDDLIYGLEVFEFDASRRLSKKGSKLRLEEAEIDRSSKSHKHYEKVLTTELTLNNYRKSLTDIFEEHCKNLPNYIENLKTRFSLSNNQVRICFIIIDKTPGNLVVYPNGKNQYYTPLLDEIFIEKLKHCKGLDYLITFHEEFYVRYPTFISLTPEHINFLDRNCYKNLQEVDIKSHRIKKTIDYFPCG